MRPRDRLKVLCGGGQLPEVRAQVAQREMRAGQPASQRALVHRRRAIQVARNAGEPTALVAPAGFAVQGFGS